MKKFCSAMICLCMIFVLAACVPTEKDGINTAPDLTQDGAVLYDFDQLHNDSVAAFEGRGPYAFVNTLDISGNNDSRTVTVTAVCMEGASEEMASSFAAAVLRGINDAAMIQDATVKVSGPASFGSLWDSYGCRIRIYTESEAAKENGTPVFRLDHKAGETIPLDSDIEAYEAGWEREMEIFRRNEE